MWTKVDFRIKLNQSERMQWQQKTKHSICLCWTQIGKYFPGFNILLGSKRSFILFIASTEIWSFAYVPKYLFFCWPNPCSADIDPPRFITASKINGSSNAFNSVSSSKLPGVMTFKWMLPSMTCPQLTSIASGRDIRWSLVSSTIS